jgi:hypothetical protein
LFRNEPAQLSSPEVIGSHFSTPTGPKNPCGSPLNGSATATPFQWIVNIEDTVESAYGSSIDGAIISTYVQMTGSFTVAPL